MSSACRSWALNSGLCKAGVERLKPGDTCCVLRSCVLQAGDLCAVEGDATKSRREIRGFAMLWCLVSGGRMGAGPRALMTRLYRRRDKIAGICSSRVRATTAPLPVAEEQH